MVMARVCDRVPLWGSVMLCLTTAVSHSGIPPDPQKPLDSLSHESKKVELSGQIFEKLTSEFSSTNHEDLANLLHKVSSSLDKHQSQGMPKVPVCPEICRTISVPPDKILFSSWGISVHQLELIGMVMRHVFVPKCLEM